MSQSAPPSQVRGGPDRGHVMHAVTGRSHNLALPTRTERGFLVAVLSDGLDVTRDAAVIARTVGTRRRLVLEEEARRLGIRVLNPIVKPGEES